MRVVLAVAFCVLLYLAVRYVYRKGLDLFKSAFSNEALVKGPFADPANRPSLLAMKKAGLRPRIGKSAWGRRIILAASILAFFSLGSDWAKFFVFEKSGVDIGTTFLMSLWLYPFVAALFKLRIREGIGVGLALLNFGIAAATVYQISSKQVFGFFGVSAGLGAWAYLAASVFLWAGISTYCIDEDDEITGNISADTARGPEG